MRKSGIYLIENIITKEMYVGSTRNLSQRKVQHFFLLKRGEHENRRIQKSFNAHGEHVFAFVVLEECEKEDLVKREQYWMDSLKPTLNIMLTATNNSITRTAALLEKYKRHSEIMTGRKASKETKLKMSESHKTYYETHTKVVSEEQKQHLSKINIGENNPNWGLKRTDETRKKISDGNARKIRAGFVSPDGVEFRSVTNLGWFCKEHELNYWAMNSIDKGKQKSYKGWTKIQT